MRLFLAQRWGFWMALRVSLDEIGFGIVADVCGLVDCDGARVVDPNVRLWAGPFMLQLGYAA